MPLNDVGINGKDEDEPMPDVDSSEPGMNTVPNNDTTCGSRIDVTREGSQAAIVDTVAGLVSADAPASAAAPASVDAAAASCVR